MGLEPQPPDPADPSQTVEVTAEPADTVAFEVGRTTRKRPVQARSVAVQERTDLNGNER